MMYLYRGERAIFLALTTNNDHDESRTLIISATLSRRDGYQAEGVDGGKRRRRPLACAAASGPADNRKLPGYLC